MHSEVVDRETYEIHHVILTDIYDRLVANGHSVGLDTPIEQALAVRPILQVVYMAGGKARVYATITVDGEVLQIHDKLFSNRRKDAEITLADPDVFEKIDEILRNWICS